MSVDLNAGVDALTHTPKRKRLRRRTPRRSLELFHWNDLPDYLRDNEYIFTGYRADTGFRGSLRSLFKLHNESGNVWTHLIGFFLFLFLLSCIIRSPPTPLALPVEDAEHAWVSVVDRFHNTTVSVVRNLQHWEMPNFDVQGRPTSALLAALSSSIHRGWEDVHKSWGDVKFSVDSVYDALDDWLHGTVSKAVMWPVPRWPFYVFMGGAMTCLLLSAGCHLLGCCSKHISATIWRFDYAGIIANIVSSFYPAVYYVFLCHPIARTVYLLAITSAGVATMVLCLGEKFQANEWRSTRATCFALLGLIGIVPWAHAYLELFHIQTIQSVLVIDGLMGAAYLTGALFYATRMPERFFPGKFDILFHSHQIFHMFVVAGAYLHYLGVLELLQWRDASGGCALDISDGKTILRAATEAAQHLDFESLMLLMRGRLRELWEYHGSKSYDFSDNPNCMFSNLLYAMKDQCPWPSAWLGHV